MSEFAEFANSLSVTDDKSSPENSTQIEQTHDEALSRTTTNEVVEDTTMVRPGAEEITVEGKASDQNVINSTPSMAIVTSEGEYNTIN